MTFDMWVIFGLIIVMMLGGLAPLHHVIFAKHTSRDLWCLVPLATLCITGLISLLNHATSLVILAIDSASSYASVNVLLLSLLWRSVRMANLAVKPKMMLFTMFMTSLLGMMMPMVSMVPPGQHLTVVLSYQYPELFQNAPIKHYVFKLCIEYAMFYLPLFFVMFKLHRKRTILKNTGLRAEKGCVTSEAYPEEDCPRCGIISPFLDLVSVCLAVMFIVARPLYMLGYWWEVGVLTDIENHFFILPFYTAMCLLNIPCSRKAAEDARTNRNLLPVTSG